MFCPRCGKELPDASTQCPSCGALLSSIYQIRPAYSYNSDASLFHNPHTGLLVFLVIFSFLTSIFCNCGLFQYHESLDYFLEDADWLQYFPMWLLAAGGLFAFFSGGSDSLFQQSIADSSNIEWFYFLFIGILIVMAVMTLCSFIFSCIIAGKSSLLHRHPSSQLRSMNVFLILNWIFWLIYTLIILLPMALIYRESAQVVFVIRYTIWGYLYTICLIVVTILKCIYGKQILNSYSVYEQQNRSSRYAPYF